MAQVAFAPGPERWEEERRPAPPPRTMRPSVLSCGMLWCIAASLILVLHPHRVSQQQKNPTRNMGSGPRSFSRRAPAATAWEGVLTFGVAPITVAGPWPILTAFPASHACEMSKGSVCWRTNAVNPGEGRWLSMHLPCCLSSQRFYNKPCDGRSGILLLSGDELAVANGEFAKTVID